MNACSDISCRVFRRLAYRFDSNERVSKMFFWHFFQLFLGHIYTLPWILPLGGCPRDTMNWLHSTFGPQRTIIFQVSVQVRPYLLDFGSITLGKYFSRNFLLFLNNYHQSRDQELFYTATPRRRRVDDGDAADKFGRADMAVHG